MNNTCRAFIIIIATMFVVAPLHAGVKVTTPESQDSAPATNPAEPKASSSGGVEKRVALVTAEKKYLTASTGGALDLSGAKVGSKQIFTLIDLNGGELADGDEVKVRYTPNTGGVPDPSKASYWHVASGGVKRSKDGDAFKIKKIETKFAFQTVSGKFLTGTAVEGFLTLSDKQDGALLVEIVELEASGKAPKKSAAQ
jgi:hypothetical protein